MEFAYNSRRFSDVYSAAGQRTRLDSGWGHDDFLVHLRVDAVLAHTIVLPDTYVLDGAYLLETEPDDLRLRIGREVTGRQLPILVRSRRETLAESLRFLLVRPGSQFLNRFPFNAIQNEAARNALADVLAVFPIDEYKERVHNDVPGELVSLLRELIDRAGFNADSDLERMHAGWSRWIAAERVPEEYRRLKVVAWDRPLNVQSIAADDRYRLDPDEHLGTSAGRELYREILLEIEQGGTHRSDASHRFREKRTNMKIATEERDLHTIQTWYDRTRHRAIARQHNCTAFAYTQHPSAMPVGPLQRRLQSIVGGEVPNSQEVTVPGDFYYQILSIDSDAFARAMRKVQAEQIVWWQTGKTDSLRHVIDEILAVAPSSSGNSRLTGLIEVLGRLVSGTVPVVGPAISALVSRLAGGRVAANATGRVVEYLVQEHPNEKP